MNTVLQTVLRLYTNMLLELVKNHFQHHILEEKHTSKSAIAWLKLVWLKLVTKVAVILTITYVGRYFISESYIASYLMLERRKFETASIMVSFHQNCYSLFVFTQTKCKQWHLQWQYVFTYAPHLTLHKRVGSGRNHLTPVQCWASVKGLRPRKKKRLTLRQ